MKKQTGSELRGETQHREVLGAVRALERVISTLAEQTENLTEQMQEMRTNYATKGDFLELKEELKTEIRAISKAVDKDAETIVDHEKRITRVEKKLALA